MESTQDISVNKEIYGHKPSWWKEGIIYQVYPRSFRDSDGDGIGDLRGLIDSLEYLESLHTDILWLCPVFDSPNADNGYDIRDYYNIMPEYGTMADFEELLEKAHGKGIRVILDVVFNHCSDEHEWFRRSRESKQNPYRNYFIWRPPGPDGGPPNNWLSFFGGSAWTFDELTGEYYLHLFSEKQPDLNWECDEVRREIFSIMKFWLDKGVDGFRLDVITLISKHADFQDIDFTNARSAMLTKYTNGPRLHEFLKEMNRNVFRHYDAMSLGEGLGITPDDVLIYVGDGSEELNLVYHFDLLDFTFGEERYGPAEPLDLVRMKEIYNKWNKTIGEGGWLAHALGNHDYPRMVSRLGEDKNFWRLSAKMLLTLLATQQGTVTLYQGDEIGMTNVAFPSIDDYNDIEATNFYRLMTAYKTEEEKARIFQYIQQAGRDNARTPFQWMNAENAGFTTGKPWLGVNPNYKIVNVELQERDPNSILNYCRQLLIYRKDNEVFVYGDYEGILPEDEHIFAYTRTLGNQKKLVVLNFCQERNFFAIPWIDRSPVVDINNYDLLDTTSDGIWLHPYQAIVWDFTS